MLVRSLRTHFHDAYRKEGEEFEHSGPLYRHIEPVTEPAPEPEPPTRAFKNPGKQGSEKA